MKRVSLTRREIWISGFLKKPCISKGEVLNLPCISKIHNNKLYFLPLYYAFGLIEKF